MKRITLSSTIQIGVIREYNGISKETALTLFKKELDRIKSRLESSLETDTVFTDEILVEDLQ